MNVVLFSSSVIDSSFTLSTFILAGCSSSTAPLSSQLWRSGCSHTQPHGQLSLVFSISSLTPSLKESRGSHECEPCRAMQYPGSPLFVCKMDNSGTSFSLGARAKPCCAMLTRAELSPQCTASAGQLYL